MTYLLAPLVAALDEWHAHPGAGTTPPQAVLADGTFELHVNVGPARLVALPGAVLSPDTGAGMACDTDLRDVLTRLARAAAVALEDLADVLDDSGADPTATVNRVIRWQWSNHVAAYPAAA